jgi:hypothetical protein
MRCIHADFGTFIHEAGHAVGRVLMAPEQGWAPSKAIFRIAIGSGASALAQGTVFGPLTSKYMHDFIDAKYPGDHMLSAEEIASLYPDMRAAGGGRRDKLPSEECRKHFRSNGRGSLQASTV